MKADSLHGSRCRELGRNEDRISRHDDFTNLLQRSLCLTAVRLENEERDSSDEKSMLPTEHWKTAYYVSLANVIVGHRVWVWPTAYLSSHSISSRDARTYLASPFLSEVLSLGWKVDRGGCWFEIVRTRTNTWFRYSTAQWHKSVKIGRLGRHDVYKFTSTMSRLEAYSEAHIHCS